MTNHNNQIPVIAVDGPSASGKGSVAQRVANTLGFHYLDSGALYRIVAFMAHQQNIEWEDEDAVAEVAKQLTIQFIGEQVLVNDQDVSTQIRTEQMGRGASRVAVHPKVRAALFEVQRDFCQTPGLVADGRDMATVIFPESITKIFLTASTEIRADRRYKQLLNSNNPKNADFDAILKDLQIRDTRDRNRDSAPLTVHEDATTINTDNMTIDAAVKQILEIYQQNT
jgi:cytidylate kinase